MGVYMTSSPLSVLTVSLSIWQVPVTERGAAEVVLLRPGF